MSAKRDMADPIYLDVRAGRYLVQWPDVTEFDAVSVIRLHTAGLVRSYKDPTVQHDNGVVGHDWKGHESTLTRRGLIIAFYAQSQSFNYYTVSMALDLWSMTELKAKGPKLTAFMELFKIASIDEGVAEYIKNRKEEHRFPLLTEHLTNPFTGREISLFPKLWETAQAIGPEPEPEPVIAEEEDDDADFGALEPAPVLEEIFVAADYEVTAADCGYCEGTGKDPFEDDKPCPQCKAPAVVEDEWDIA